MRHGSLFSGIGGFDLAAEWAGWTNVFQVEKDKWCNKLLKQNFPSTNKHNDIFDFYGTEEFESIDIISGGFPCQPFSLAGKRKGSRDDRFLWPQMLRVIREHRPSYVVGENVRGIITIEDGMVFEQVCLDLEAENYEVQSYIIPACATGAPHRRDRVWIIAYNNGFRLNRFSSENEVITAQRGVDAQCNDKSFGSMGYAANSSSERCEYGFNHREERCICGDKGLAKENQSEWDGWKCGAGKACDAENPNCSTHGGQKAFRKERQYRDISPAGEIRNSDAANSSSKRFTKQHIPSFYGEKGFNRIGNYEGVPNWDGFPTQSPVCRRDDGIPNRVDRIKGLGNAIVPQVAYNIFQAINESDRILKELK